MRIVNSDSRLVIFVNINEPKIKKTGSAFYAEITDNTRRPDYRLFVKPAVWVFLPNFKTSKYVISSIFVEDFLYI